MNLDLTEFQALLRDSARTFFEREVSLDVLRAVDRSDGHLPALWDPLAANGWPGLLLPESAGGVEAGALDLGVLLEEFGRAGLNSVFRHTVAAGYLLGLTGTEGDLLGQLASGQRVATVALTEPGRSYRRFGITTTLRKGSGGGWLLGGRKTAVPYAGVTEQLFVLTRDDDGAPAVVVVGQNAPGVSMARRTTVAQEPVFDVEFSDVELTHGARLNLEGDSAALERAIDLMVLMLCAETAGLVAEMLRMTAAYVSERVQFGRPIGTFQAVQCRVADSAILADGARLATYEALAAWDRGHSWQRETAVAKAFTSQAALLVSWDAHLLHGGVGLTTEHRLHYYTRKAKANQLTLGTEDDHLRELADLLLGAA
jgi:alkylation response protein AidB-like acyl-CoA dehydrogenase